MLRLVKGSYRPVHRYHMTYDTIIAINTFGSICLSVAVVIIAVRVF